MFCIHFLLLINVNGESFCDSGELKFYVFVIKAVFEIL